MPFGGTPSTWSAVYPSPSTVVTRLVYWMLSQGAFLGLAGWFLSASYRKLLPLDPRGGRRRVVTVATLYCPAHIWKEFKLGQVVSAFLEGLTGGLCRAWGEGLRPLLVSVPAAVPSCPSAALQAWGGHWLSDLPFSKMTRQNLELVPVWDAGTADGRLAMCWPPDLLDSFFFFNFMYFYWKFR